jgi:hypothetical protein
MMFCTTVTLRAGSRLTWGMDRVGNVRVGPPTRQYRREGAGQGVRQGGWEAGQHRSDGHRRGTERTEHGPPPPQRAGNGVIHVIHAVSWIFIVATPPSDGMWAGYGPPIGSR